MKSRSPSRDSAVSANSWRFLRGQAKLTALNDMFWAYEAEVLISSTCDRVDDWIIILSAPSGVLLIQCRRASLTGEKCARMLYTRRKLRCHLMLNAQINAHSFRFSSSPRHGRSTKLAGDIREFALFQFGLPEYWVRVREAMPHPPIFLYVIEINEAA